MLQNSSPKTKRRHSSVFQTFFFLWHNSPQWARASSFTRFLDHTQRRTTVSRSPLNEWSARRRDLNLTIHNTHNKQTSITPVGFEPTISAGERPQTYALDRAATGTGYSNLYCGKCKCKVGPTHAIRSWGSEGIASLILYFDTRWRQVFSLMPWLHYVWGKSPHHPLKRKLGVFYSQSGSFVEEKNLSILPRYEPWTVQSLAQSLYSLCCPSFHVFQTINTHL